MCITFTALNANTIINAYYIPCIDNTFYFLESSVIISKIDFARGYQQVWIAKGYKHITTF